MVSYTKTLALVVLGLCFASSLANDVPIRFCVKGCKGGSSNVIVKLEGCIDKPATCKTGDDGCCVMDKWETAPHYCFGSANNKCVWSLPEDKSHTYIASASTLLRRSVGEVSPREYSCCKCNGQDTCRRTIWRDAAYNSCPVNDRDCFWNNFQTYGSGPVDYFTVLFAANNCGKSGVDKDGVEPTQPFGRKLAQANVTDVATQADDFVELGEPATVEMVLKELITDADVMGDNNGKRRALL